MDTAVAVFFRSSGAGHVGDAFMEQEHTAAHGFTIDVSEQRQALIGLVEGLEQVEHFGRRVVAEKARSDDALTASR